MLYVIYILNNHNIYIYSFTLVVIDTFIFRLFYSLVYSVLFYFSPI